MAYRDQNELKQLYWERISLLQKLIRDIDELEIDDPMRDTLALDLVIHLRTLLCKVSETESLSKRCYLENQILLPFWDSSQVLNVIPSYSLVAIKVANGAAKFEASNEKLDKTKVPVFFLSLEAWLKEIIIDFKDGETEPITREKLIRILADEVGAHVDDKIKKELYIIKTKDIMPVRFLVNNMEIKGEGSNLFAESIISITKEFLFANENYIDLNQKRIGIHKYFGYKLDYGKENYKYYVSKEDSKEMLIRYSADYNKDSVVKEKTIGLYNIRYDKRAYYQIGIIDN